MATISVLMPFLPSRAEQFVPFMALVQQTAARRLWTGQPLSFDVHQGFAYGAAMGFKVPVGTAVALVPIRHPFTAALEARGLALTTGHPAVTGFGPGAASFQRAVLGQAYDSPITAMREFFVVLRALLAGEAVDFDGTYFTMRGAQTPTPPGMVQLGAGVLRPRMAELAGEVADVAITWLAPPRYLEEIVVPHLEKGAVRADRQRPRVVAVVSAALGQPERDPVAMVARTHQHHLRGPHYRDMLAQSGIAVDLDDLPGAARALLEAGAVAYGEPEVLRAQVDAYHRAGADEVALHLTGPSNGQPLGAAVEELRAIVGAVTAT